MENTQQQLPLVGNVIYRPFYGWVAQAKIAQLAITGNYLATLFAAVKQSTHKSCA